MDFLGKNQKTLANPRIKRLINSALLLLISILYGSFLLLPMREWIAFKVDLSKVFPTIPHQDAGYYLGQIDGFRTGMRAFGNPFYFEHSGDGFGNGTSALFAFWGYAGNLLGLDILQTYIMTTFLTGMLTAICIYFFVGTVIKSKKVQLCLTLVLTFLICSTELGRPSPTQLGLWILLLLLKLQYEFYMKNSKSNSRILFFSSLLIFLTFSNTLYAIVVAVVTLLCLPKKPFRASLKSSTEHLLPILVGFIPFTIQYFRNLPNEDQQAARFGILNSHLPGAVSLTFLLAVMIAIATIQVKKNKSADKQWSLVLLLASLSTLNSQVLTGIHYEMESHYGLFVKIILMTACINACTTYRMMILCGIISASLMFSSLTKVAQTLESTPSSNASESKLLNTILRNSKPGEVVYYRNPVLSSSSRQMISILSSTYIYFDEAGNLARANDKELIERFSCTYFGSDDLLKENLQSIYLHKFENSQLMFSKWNKLFGQLGLPEIGYPLKESQIEFDLAWIDRYQGAVCNDGEFKYKVDLQIIERDNRFLVSRTKQSSG
jgi:hypothetical protein